MNQDTLHGLAALVSVASLCAGMYLLAGLGAALCLFGGLVLAAVIYARTRSTDAGQPD